MPEKYFDSAAKILLT